MLYAKDLMIGDWVAYRRDFPDRVTGISSDGLSVCLAKDGWISVIDFLPIPISPEILEKNFPTAGELAWWPVEDGLHCESRNTEDIMVSGVFRFVHQLQHALRLCGIEKEVVL